ncbi:hypothetical protein AAKU61_000596 [Undibacterium sp. GrIS 1.2]|uniref:outer membrane beta-barrel protein n=1 Tax=Undibacterium sp. GrIS 1.2 TaxID=3143933 RepID=UPI00339A4138
MFKAKSIFFASIASLLLGTAATSAMAADTTTTEAGAYAGLNIAAQAKYDLDCSSNGQTGCNRKANSSGKIYAGYMGAPSLFEGINVSQGIELMYYKVGSATRTFIGSSDSFNTKGLAASYVLQANFNNFSLNGRAGAAYTTDKYGSSFLGTSNTNHSVVPVIGLGARYSLTKNISLNADYDRLVSDANNAAKGPIHMFSLGVGYKF